MAITQEFEIITEKITSYLSRINQLETDLSNSKKETAQLKKDLIDARKEIESLTKQKKDLLTLKAEHEEALKNFKVLGEKDKKELDKRSREIDELTERNKILKEETEGLQKDIEELKNPDNKS
ncbi:MAG: hypothetical protein K8R63_01485 [Bacteroidales bacterium]|nr:hypothetical protein [Bacteroidales bacterium]